MERPHVLVLSAMTLATLAMSVSAGFAQSAQDLVGTWTLVSAVTEKDATKSDTFGPGAAGVLVQMVPAETVVRVYYFDPRQSGDVVRTVRDYCNRTAS